MLRRNVQCLLSENFTLAISTPTFTTLTDLLTPCALFSDVTEHFREGTLSHTYDQLMAGTFACKTI